MRFFATLISSDSDNSYVTALHLSKIQVYSRLPLFSQVPLVAITITQSPSALIPLFLPKNKGIRGEYVSDTVLLRGLEKIRFFYSVIFWRCSLLLGDSIGVEF
jgi:hypothetical protein